MKILIGCDIGTSGTKAVAMTADGKILADAYEKYGIISPKSGWAEQDVNVWFQAAIKTIKAVIKETDNNEHVGICISTLYGGTGVLCDENMNPLCSPIIWMDRRAEIESEEIREKFGSEYILEKTGNGIDSYFGYTKLLWIKKNKPDIWKRTAHIIPINSYLVYKMTGVLAVDHCSAGNIGGIYDIKRHGWSKDMCQELGIPFDFLPEKFLEPYEVVGVINKEYQAELGLKNECQLCMGTVDCISSMLSAGIIEEGDNAAILGTSLNWGHIHSGELNDPGLISMPYCIDSSRLNYTYGGASTAGALPRWFLTGFLGEEDQKTYQMLEDEIKRQNIGPGADGLVLLPYFMGERTPIWDENASGTLIGVTLNHNRAHVYRAILESVAYAMKDIIQNMAVIQPDKIILMGGGAKSKFWCSIFADVTGIPVYVPKTGAEAPLGDAFLAGIGTGIINDFSEIKSWISYDTPIMPNMENNKVYSKYFEIYKDIYPVLKLHMKKLKKIQNEN